LPRISSIEGRILDMLRTGDGHIIPGEFFPHILKDVLEIKEYQVTQERLNRIVISAVLSAPMSEKSRMLLDSEIRKVAGPGLKIEVVPVQSIPRLASGKRRVTVGLVQ
jgi:phenylacetate-CoA ligase